MPKDLKPKYTPSHLMGENVVDHLKGTRLAAHLIQIRDRFGKSDVYLRTLATKALEGHIFTDSKTKNDIFTAIGDRLAAHGESNYYARHDPYIHESKRGTSAADEDYKNAAKDLSQSINWHRVGHAVQLDKLLSDHIESLVPQEYQAKGQTFKVAQNWLKDARFKKELINLVKSQTGENSGLGLPSSYASEDRIRAGVERLALREEYRQELQERDQKQLKETRQTVLQQKKAPTTQLSAVDTLNWLPGSGPAWSHKFTDKGIKRVVNKDLSAEQYKRQQIAERVKYTLWGLFGGSKKPSSPLPKVTTPLNTLPDPQVPLGVSISGRATRNQNQLDNATRERVAVAELLSNKGVPFADIPAHLDEVRAYYHALLKNRNHPDRQYRTEAELAHNYHQFMQLRKDMKVQHDEIRSRLAPIIDSYLSNIQPPEVVSELEPVENVLAHTGIDEEGKVISPDLVGKTPEQIAQEQQERQDKVHGLLVEQEADTRKKLLANLQKTLKQVREKGTLPELDALTQAVQNRKKVREKIKPKKGAPEPKPLPKKKVSTNDNDEPLKLKSYSERLKYNRENHPYYQILKTMTHNDFAGNKWADPVKRGALADAYQELGDESNMEPAEHAHYQQGAELIRSGRPFIMRGDHPHPAVEKTYRVSSTFIAPPQLRQVADKWTPQEIVDNIANMPIHHVRVPSSIVNHEHALTDPSLMRHVWETNLPDSEHSGYFIHHDKNDPRLNGRGNTWDVKQSILLPIEHAHHEWFNSTSGETH